MVRQNDPLHIKVTTASYFDWRGGNGLVAMVLLDGRTALQSSILKKSADGQQMEWTIDTWNLWRGQAEGWKRTQFKFMEITKDDVHSRRFEEQETFDVRVCRVLIDEHSRTPWNKAPLFFQKMRNTTFGFSEVEYKIV